MTDKELQLRHWLNRAFYADKKVKALEMLAEQCRERAQGLSHSVEGNDVSGHSTPENGTENALMKLADIEERAQRQREEAVCASDEIQQAISTLHDEDLETVLIHRYLLFETIEQVAESIGYDPRTVKRKIRRAIEKLSPDVLECPPDSVV
ncbi:MAG: sigma-70 family RNA polymerase sigma factor [Ruminococcus sp.]|nr:sigma-70 family RNA polymerase sigma factor [Ruminococcus sp.]